MTAVLYGLVLSGGRSERMGTDKGNIKYHNKEQRIHLANLLDQVCDRSFISHRPGQYSDFDRKNNSIEDSVDCPGPVSGLLSAHLEHSNAAFLVVACDMPFIQLKHLEQLVSKRLSSSDITLYRNQNFFFEPFFAIWEPSGLTLLNQLAIDQKFSFQRIIPQLKANVLDLEEFDNQSENNFLRSINSKNESDQVQVQNAMRSHQLQINAKFRETQKLSETDQAT